jgi:integrase
LAAILDKCEEKKNKYPFQSFVLKMQMYTGRRRETILKLKWSMIKWKEQTFEADGKIVKVYGHIDIPGEIVKTKNDDQIWITPILKNVINEQHKTRELHHWAMFIDWMCPSIRVKDKNFLRKGNENNTDAARMKDVRGFWDEITAELGITGEAAQRMFRNTHENRVNANRKARSTWDVISVTGRADTRSAESYYLNKKLTPQTAELMDDMNDQWEKVNKLRLVKK